MWCKQYRRLCICYGLETTIPARSPSIVVEQGSGALTQIPDSPYSFPGRNPVALVTSPNGKYLYVVYHDDNTVVEYAIGTDGKLYPQHTYNTPGTEPTAITINSAGTLLFVVDTFQAGFTPANPGPGAVVVYPVNSDGSLGTNIANGNLPYWPVQFNPSSVNVTALASRDSTTDFVYVVNTNTAAQAGTISAFSYSTSERWRRSYSDCRQSLPCRSLAQCQRQRSYRAVLLHD